MKITIITGGSRGLGRTTAIACAAQGQGQGVILTYNRNSEQAVEVVQAIEANGGKAAALGRIGEPDDVGYVIASLLSDTNRWINAQTIEVAGGYLI
ncbi:SDR family oxidoreductase [Gluconobacter wancherniae]|uniref:SDR family oxidoreductase n=1 Tax=Gluconobacter wancherniae TaxID=1307955 RepID=UPI001B8BB31D|nr:SDR family oxidoreductase [Gluconobacter wancherniae]MBS1089736.1 SDR family oxidoreductase [Gluconobacter wancherniae]